MEDTDEYDDADLGLNVNPKEYHKQKAKMTPLKERIIGAYEAFIRRKEKEAEMSWKKSVKYRGVVMTKPVLWKTMKIVGAKSSRTRIQ